MAEPAMQGPLAGEIRLAVFIAQTHTDVAGPPSRVLLAQCKSLCVERMLLGRSPRTRLVGGFDTLGVAAEALNQLSNGSGAEAEIVGDGRSGLAATDPLSNEFANGQREWRRHGNPRK